MRTRLIGAFIILIITSASATIVIASVVFGNKMFELAISKMEVGLTIEELGLSARLERLEVIARAVAERIEGVDQAPRSCPSIILSERMVDFMVIATSKEALVLQMNRSWRKSADIPTPLSWLRPSMSNNQPSTSKKAHDLQRPCLTYRLSREDIGSSTLFDFASKAAGKSRTISGMVVLESGPLSRLGYHDPPDKGLLLSAAAPLPSGATLILGSIINHRTELVMAPIGLLSPTHSRQYEASLFLGATRIATTLDPLNMGTLVDKNVVEKVLNKGQFYVGSAKVVGETFYTAYRPLRDYRGVPVGILGVGAREEVYSDVTKRTILLFSGLIALGMIFGMAMTYMFSSWLIRPVSELAEGMDRVARDDLNYKVRIYSQDELGRLAQAFNLMVKNIKERDIQLREMTNEKLSRMDKQISIGRLAAGVAHEINNPLTSVLSLSIMMLKELQPNDPRKEDLEIVVEETRRCREIVSNLLDFARESKTEMRIIELNQVIRETLVLTSKYEGMDRVQTVTRLSEERLYVNADPKQLQQVLTNIISNAAEAIQDRGRITISTDEDSSGGYVVLQVKDTGRGIPEDDLKRIFEPFFTTKGGTGKGTGLGLSVSLGIVRKHEGTIEIQSEEGKGTTVTVMLPRASVETTAQT